MVDGTPVIKPVTKGWCNVCVHSEWYYIEYT